MIYKKCIQVILILIVSVTLTSASAESDHVLKSFIGEWQSKGNTFGQAAISQLSWSPALGGKFIQVNYSIVADTESRETIFTGLAYYQQTSSNSFKAFWADSSGDLHPIDAIRTGNVLVSTWGRVGEKLGRTRYELTGSDEMTVTDWIMNDNEWQQFNHAVFSRHHSEAAIAEASSNVSD